MATDVKEQMAPRGLAWWMYAATTGAILITSIDRVLLPTVLPGRLKVFDLIEGVPSGASSGLMIGLGSAVPREA